MRRLDIRTGTTGYRDQVFICATGVSDSQRKILIRPWAERPGWTLGKESEDIGEFLRQHPQALA